MNGQSAGKSFAYILGVYIGDGCITKPKNRPNYSYTFRLDVIDKDFADKFTEELNALGCKSLPREWKRNEKPCYIVETRDKDLTKVLLEDTQHKKIIPDYVKKWDKENKLSFISGIMDSEGFISKRKKIMTNGLPSFQMGIKMDYKMLKQIKPIMQSVGIKVGKYTMSPQKWCTNVQTANLSINIKSWVSANAHFNIKRKEDKVRQYINNTNLNDYMPNVEEEPPKDIV